VFDVLGHQDLAKRYTKRFLGSYDMSPFGGLIDEILSACLAADLTPEINTSSLRQGLDETMPNEAAAARYAALGGKAMSLGSDAHRAEDIGAGFDRAVTMLRDAGLECVAVFQQRERHHLPNNTA
jgi:histidinol-phosphatase (PHP family)